MTYIDNWSYDEYYDDYPEMDIDYPDDPEIEDAERGHASTFTCSSRPGFGCCSSLIYVGSDHKTYNAKTHKLHTCGEDTKKQEVTMEEVLGKPKESTMNNTVKLIPRPESKPSGISAFSLKVGEYGRVVGAGSYAGHIVLKAREYVVDITNPNNTWLVNDFTAPYVETLKTGDRLEITLGFTSEFVERIAKMAQENRINAIKEIRTVTNWGLKESKEYVESLLLPF